MQKAERLLRACRQPLPVVANGFEEAESSDQVRLNELAGAVDRAVHMTFGGEVYDRRRAMLREQLRHQGRIADVAPHENVPCITAD